MTGILAWATLAGYRIAKAFDAPPGVRLVRGPAGLGVLALVGTATVAQLGKKPVYSKHQAMAFTKSLDCERIMNV